MPVLLFIKWLIGRAAEPALPIQQLCVDAGGGRTAPIILKPIRPDLCDAAQAAALDEGSSALKMRPTALLHAALQDLLRSAHGLNQQLAFFQSMRDGLF